MRTKRIKVLVQNLLPEVQAYIYRVHINWCYNSDFPPRPLASTAWHLTLGSYSKQMVDLCLWKSTLSSLEFCADSFSPQSRLRPEPRSFFPSPLLAMQTSCRETDWSSSTCDVPALDFSWVKFATLAKIYWWHHKSDWNETGYFFRLLKRFNARSKAKGCYTTSPKITQRFCHKENINLAKHWSQFHSSWLWVQKTF